jgi:hypothetical protein
VGVEEEVEVEMEVSQSVINLPTFGGINVQK